MLKYAGSLPFTGFLAAAAAAVAQASRRQARLAAST